MDAPPNRILTNSAGAGIPKITGIKVSYCVMKLENDVFVFDEFVTTAIDKYDIRELLFIPDPTIYPGVPSADVLTEILRGNFLSDLAYTVQRYERDERKDPATYKTKQESQARYLEQRRQIQSVQAGQ